MPERRDQRRLGQILLEQGVVTSKQLNEALKEQALSGKFIGEILVSHGSASEAQVAKSLSEQLGFAFVDIAQMMVEPKVIDLVPEELCLRRRAMPLFVAQDILTVAMFNPLDVQAVDEFQTASGHRIRPVFACPTAILNVVKEQYHQPPKQPGVSPEASEQLISQAQFTAPSQVSAEQVDSLKQAASLAPVVNMVDDIINKAVQMAASDIHLEPERDNFNCRYRIDGILYPASEIPFDSQAAVISRIKIMANMDIAEKRLAQDGRIRVFSAGRDVDLRISTFPTIYGENMVIRILDRSAGIIKLSQLGFSKPTLDRFSQLIHRPHGILLVTGPTGSGKTTTLYAALSEINSLEKNIITLEDPVEYDIPHVRQSQVNVKAGLTFASGLRSLVRQDPDIIMIGEIRDKETADIAIHAALTGHLVFSTLHTNDAASAVTRLIDMGVEPFLVASSLVGILAQRLARTLCDSCKQKYTPSDELLKQAGIQRKPSSAKFVFYKESSCPKCSQRGFIGRTGIFELLVLNDRIRDLITAKASATAIKEAAVKSGLVTLRTGSLAKVTSGITSVSEIMRITEES